MARRSFRVSVDGEVFNVEVEEINNKGPVLQDNMSVKQGEPEEIKPVSTRTEDMQPDASDDDVVVKAPMPGVILDIKVAEGDEVKENDVLVILEAMKMENEITSPQSGMVKKILINKNATVNSDESLIIIG